MQDWNNRFGTTITFVDSSGIINANSGIILTPGTPSVTTNRIYNVGGALYFNGAALAGGYTSWTISDSGGNSESVTNGTNIIFSGANGVATVYNPTTNVMMVSGTNLGGGGSYNWRIADSGGAADTIANNELVVFSGVNGIGTIYNPTTNVMVLSGINPYSSWILADSGRNSKNIVNNTQVIFSGVNGVATVYNPVANTMMVSGTQNAFSTISIAGQSDVVADSITDTLTLIAGTNITLSTNASQDSITINSTAGGGGSYNWRIADSGGVPDTIISGDLVMFSGVNGIATNYDPVNNVMTLSGNYSWTLRDSGNNSKAITNNTP
ncbi:MAG: hypothetical protein EB059_11040, partial [Alphaproteobacteria bacterium]|nr:hypothetical protein [Alphaproteobacteria bacterium]